MRPRRIAVFLSAILAAYYFLPALVLAGDCVHCQPSSPMWGVAEDDAHFPSSGDYGDVVPPALVAGFGPTFRTGLSFSAGSGLLDEVIRDPGWTIEATLRQPLGRGTCRTQTFFEFGGSYIQNYGDNTQVPTGGTFVILADPDQVPERQQVSERFDEFFLTRLDQLQRASLQVGLGASYLPCQLNQPDRRDVYVTWRGGLRFGHVHARFDQRPTNQLQTRINEALQDPALDIREIQLRDDVVRTDNFFGLYTGLGLDLTSRPLPLDCMSWAEYRLTFEVIYEHAWFELGDYASRDDGLGTLGGQLGLTFVW